MDNKRDGFLMYKSHYPAIKCLSQEQKGNLLDLIFQYHSDKNISSPDMVVNMAFSFIKNQFEIDNIKYEQQCEKNKANIEKRWDKEKNTSRKSGIRSNTNDTKHTDNDKDKDNDNDKDKDNDNDKDINTSFKKEAKHPLEERKAAFKEKIRPFVTEYGVEMAKEFLDYWTEISEGGKKMRFEDEKFFDIKRRLVTWLKNQKFKPQQNVNDRATLPKSTLPAHKPVSFDHLKFKEEKA